MERLYYICGNWQTFLTTIFYLMIFYFMFYTRRTVLRVIGWGIMAALLLMFLLGWGRERVEASGVASTKVVSHLRSLKSAASLFYDEHKAWPSPGQEASLDEYSDHPLVNASPSRYARVILLDKQFGEVGSVDLYVGVELLSQWNGNLQVQRKLAVRAQESGLLQEPVSGGGLIPYESGLIVYMRVN